MTRKSLCYLTLSNAMQIRLGLKGINKCRMQRVQYIPRGGTCQRKEMKYAF